MNTNTDAVSSAYAYRMMLLSEKLERAASLDSKAMLDEWETLAVASMLQTWLQIGAAGMPHE